MPSDAEKLSSALLEQRIRERIYPNLKDAFKDKDTQSKIASYLSTPFNPHYMDFTTTFKNTIHWEQNSEEDVKNKEWWTFEVRAHEAQHMWDWKKIGWLFPIAYAMPHLLTVLLLNLYVILASDWSYLSLGSLLVGLGIGYTRPKKQLFFFTMLIGGALNCALFAIWKTHWNSFWLVGAGLVLSPVLNWLGAAAPRAYLEFRAYTITLAVEYWKHGHISPETFNDVVNDFTGPKYYFMLPWKKFITNQFQKRIEMIRDGSILKHPWAAHVYNVMLKSEIAYVKY